ALRVPGLIHMERATGIEPALSAWEAEVLPPNYARRNVSNDATELYRTVARAIQLVRAEQRRPALPGDTSRPQRPAPRPLPAVGREAADRAVRAEHPVARHDDRERVRGHGAADGTCQAGTAEPLGDLAVGERVSGRDR